MMIILSMCPSGVSAKEISGGESVRDKRDKRMTAEVAGWKWLLGFLQECHQDGLMLPVIAADSRPSGGERLRL